MEFQQPAVLPAAANDSTPVAALWWGVDTAAIAPSAGTHTTTVTLEYVTAEGRARTAAVDVVISVGAGAPPKSPHALQGPDDSWRQTRLAWLDSTAGSRCAQPL